MGNDRRHILILSPFLPYPPDFGGALRVFHLIKGLASRHAVHVVAPVTPDEREHLAALATICDVTGVPSGRTSRGVAGVGKRLSQMKAMMSSKPFMAADLNVPALTQVVDRITRTRQIDLIQYEFAQTALIPSPQPIPTVLDAHNVEYQLLQRLAHTVDDSARAAFNVLEWRKIRRLEAACWSGATVTIATSPDDAAAISRVTGLTVPIVPNGVDVAAFTPSITHRRPGRVVFVGAMRHHPNADAAVWYATRIHPRVRESIPGAEFVIVGADPPAEVRALASDSITVTGWVEETRSYLSEAAVAVVPLRSGGGTRLKILEAFAARTPVVSTTLGAEGINATDGFHLLLRDDPAQFADAVIALLRDNASAGIDVEAAYHLASDRYDWESAVLPALLDSHDLAIRRFREGSS